MRIAFISPFIYWYKRGIETFTLGLTQELVKINTDINITILAWHGKNSRQIPYLSDRLTLSKVPYSRYFQANIAAIYYWVNFFKSKYDIINIFFACYGEAKALSTLWLLRRQKFNIILQYPYSQVPHRYQEFKRYNLIDKADNIISVSRFVADDLKNFCGRESKIIYNGFNNYPVISRKEKESQRFEMGFKPQDKILLSVAALEERKGMYKVIKAMPLLKRKFSNLKYIILGEGSDKANLVSLINKMGLEKEVFLKGETDKPEQFYDIADVFVLLSRGEAFGLALIEAMGKGLPVVVAKVRPFDEVVNDRTGFLVDDNNLSAIAATLEKLLSDDILRQTMGEQARCLAVENFTWGKIASQYSELFYSQL
ncbi:MAG: glycosyltransferase family 4 protein [Candidatus Omnitrophica bacterium]|jgi:glycosyltransferase involved in cell wall biosynthesis|nr:glycosyltransferase family 4 protein [Candidatus Omnitrophota bacterium]